MDSNDHPRLQGALLHRIDVAVVARVRGVLAGQPIEVVDGASLHQLRDAADLDEPAGVCRVDDEQADLRVGLHVATLAALPGGVDQRALAVVVDPDQARLRLTIGQHRRQDAVDRPREQVQVGLRDAGFGRWRSSGRNALGRGGGGGAIGHLSGPPGSRE